MALFKKVKKITDSKLEIPVTPIPIEELPTEIKKVKRAIEEEEIDEEGMDEEETEEDPKEMKKIISEKDTESNYQSDELTEEKVLGILLDHEKRLKRIEYHNRLDFMD